MLSCRKGEYKKEMTKLNKITDKFLLSCEAKLQTYGKICLEQMRTGHRNLH